MSWTVDKKLAFVHKMTKEALSSIPHYDAGGPVSGPTTLNTNGVNTNQSGPSSITSPVTNTYENLGYGAIPGVTSALNGISNAFTNNFQGQAAPIQQGTNAGQLNAAYSGAQTGLNNQAGLVSQTQPGVAQGLGAQGVLSGQLAAQASGQGPNPAQAALNQSTGQNIAQQAALAAGQRGAGANAGLIASQNAQQGAATQQQAVGQSATLQAQQQLAAQQEQAALAAQQVGQGATAVQNQNQQQQNEQNILQGANTSANNAAVSQQSNINNVNSQTAASNQNEANTVFGGITAGISSLFADGGYVSDTPAFQPTASDVSSGPSVPATSTLPVSSSGSSGGSGGGGAGAGALLAALANGGQVGPQSAVGQYLNQGRSQQMPMAAQPMQMNPVPAMANGGKAMRMLPPMHGKNEMLKAKGGKVKADGKGQDAKVNHDSYANDKVPALLSQGEVVMDKDTLNDPGQIGQMARAVAQHIQQRNQSKGKRRV